MRCQYVVAVDHQHVGIEIAKIVSLRMCVGLAGWPSRFDSQQDHPFKQYIRDVEGSEKPVKLVIFQLKIFCQARNLRVANIYSASH